MQCGDSRQELAQQQAEHGAPVDGVVVGGEELLHGLRLGAQELCNHNNYCWHFGPGSADGARAAGNRLWEDILHTFLARSSNFSTKTL